LQQRAYMPRSSASFRGQGVSGIRKTRTELRDEQPQYRSAAIFMAVVMGIAAIALALSLTGSLFGIKALANGFADFLALSYGILSLLIPVYLALAAFILANPRWRPDHIFLLSASIFPFLTLAVGFVFNRDFEFRSQQFAFLDFAGKTGFSFVIVLITIMEVLTLHVIRNLLFSGETAMNKKPERRMFYLPPPQGRYGDAGGSGGKVPVGSAEQADADSDDAAGEIPELVDDDVAEVPKPMDANAAHKYPEIIKPLDAHAVSTEPEVPEDYVDSTLHKFLSEEYEYEDEEDFSDDDGENADGVEDVREEADDDAAEALEEVDDDGENDDGVEDVLEEADDDAVETLEEVDDDGENDDGVEKALEEAKAAASVYGEQVRKKTDSQRVSAKSIRSYRVPLDILNEYPDGEYWIIDRATEEAAKTLKQTLEEFKIQAEVTGIRKGPVITMFEILPAPGVKLSRIVNLQDNIALRLAASSVRIVAPIPGKHAVGIEVPNAKRNIVSFREIIEGELQQGERKMEIPLVMGKDITGEAQTIDLIQMPHLLIAGATGAGKSVCVNSMILSILYQRHPAECRLILIDPKIVELKLYNDIPHLLTPVITEPKKAFQALQYCIYEMERRYSCLDKMGVRDIRSYNRRIREKNIAQEHMPYIVVVIDEFADLMATTGKELESTVARLAAMSRAVGIHLVLATQRPSIDVITGLIKANIPSRIAFMVASKMDSRIIIDMVGAEKLLGRGDMLYAGAVDPFPVRMQGAFVSEEEVEAVVEYVKTLGKPDYIDEEMFYDEDGEDAGPSLFSDGDDPLYEKALEIVMQQGKASASFIQRRLKIGYNRSARLVEKMEQNGVVGPAQGSKPREVLRNF